MIMTSQSTSPAFSMDDFAMALEQFDYEFRQGQVIRGKVIEYSSEGAYVDIGGKAAAFIPQREASLQPVLDLSAVLPLQEERQFLIIREQNADGQVTLSIRELEIKQLWDDLEAQQNSNEMVQVRVTGVNKGGITVDVRGLRGFIPRSHLTDRENLEALQGQSITAAFLEVDRERKRVVLSQRMAAQSARFSDLEIGQLVVGKVMTLKPFGVFVDLDGTTALLHINQISNRFVSALPALFSPGQEIQALIVNLDEGKNRISLSTKVLENHPGEMLENMAEVFASVESRAERARKKLMEG